MAFAGGVAIGTMLLALPVSRAGPGGASFLEAAFTSTSAVCVTGLTVVDTPMYWSAFGEAVVLALIQIGGFGIMTLASLLGLLVARRLGLRTRLTTQTETKTLGLGDVRRVVLGVAAFSLAFEAIATVILTLRLAPATTSRSVRPPITASSMPSRRSTTPASRSTATTSSASPPTR